MHVALVPRHASWTAGGEVTRWHRGQEEKVLNRQACLLSKGCSTSASWTLGPREDPGHGTGLGTAGPRAAPLPLSPPASNIPQVVTETCLGTAKRLLCRESQGEDSHAASNLQVPGQLLNYSIELGGDL